MNQKHNMLPDDCLRVLYFIAYPQRLAGANRSLLELVTNLPAHIEPVVAIVDEGPVAEAYRDYGIPVHIVPPPDSLSRFGKAALTWSWKKKAAVATTELAPYTARLLALIRQVSPAVVHVNGPRAALLAGPAVHFSGRPLIAHLRGQKPLEGVYWQAFEHLPTRIITVCDAIQRDLSPGARKRATTVYNGTRDVSHRGAKIPWLGHLRQQGVQVVSCFAGITPFKGQHHLLEAAAMLGDRGWRDRLAFVLVGGIAESDQGYFRWLNETASARGVSNLTFAGWQSDPFSFYRDTDISVLPSVAREKLTFHGRTLDVWGNEGFPRTHLEAMSFALPVVGTDIAGVREQVVDGETGFVVSPSDPVALADSIERLASDPALARRMGEAGKRRALDVFSTHNYVRGVLNVYDGVLQMRTPAAGLTPAFGRVP